MATKYYLNSTVRTGGLRSIKAYAMDSTPGSAGTVTETLVAGASGTRVGSWVTASTEPAQTSFAGTFNVSLDIASVGADVTFSSVNLYRVDSTYASFISTSQAVSGLTSGTGIKTGSVTWGASGVTGSSTDRLMLDVAANNASMMDSENWSVNVGDVDSFVEAPWTLTATAASSPPDMRDRRIRRNSLLRR